MAEVGRAVDMLDRAHRELLEEGQQSSKRLPGVIVETPATVYQIGALVRHVNFS